ncbi:MAG: hypothetical protein ACYCZ0_03020 [Minisyncoccota bacterium]
MGKLENESKRKGRRNKVRQAVLASIKVAGLLTVVAVTPNSLNALEKLGVIKTSRQKESIDRSFSRLLKGGYLRLENGRARVTEKGEAELRRLQSYQIISEPRRWDNKWRVLIFDIPEYRKSTREKLRRTVENIGFVRLQDSVWIYPHDCEDLITLLKADFKIGKDILYMIVESLEADGAIRKRFGIS